MRFFGGLSGFSTQSFQRENAGGSIAGQQRGQPEKGFAGKTGEQTGNSQGTQTENRQETDKEHRQETDKEHRQRTDREQSRNTDRAQLRNSQGIVEGKDRIWIRKIC